MLKNIQINHIVIKMGNQFVNMENYTYIQNEPFIPISYFNNLSEESNKNENILINSPSKSRTSSKSFESEATTRKSTIDEEDIRHYQIKQKLNIDNFKSSFSALKETPFFSNLHESYNDLNDDFYLNFESGKKLRNNYYSKLICKSIWKPDRQLKKRCNNIFIFDWDNTLFPTHYLSKQGILGEEEISFEYFELLSILEECIIKLMKKTISKGDTYIITNSSEGWVEFSINKYFPNLSKYLDKITILSARDDYKNLYPDDTKMWKQKAFLSLKEKIDAYLITNILCFGDSIIELEAGKKLASEINNSFIKTIKFKECPELDDLINQIKLILKQFDYIYSTPKNLSITIRENIT